MKVFNLKGTDEMAKFHGVVQAFQEIWTGRVLDVGCRTGNLHCALSVSCNGRVQYCGVDLTPPAQIIANLEYGLPFDKLSFDIALALDVLEHTNDIHKAFGELCRVARKFVVVILPNAYELKSRIDFLLGRKLSGKYGLPMEPPPDRHRWLFSFDEAAGFTHVVGRRYGFEVLMEGCLIGPRRAALGGRFLTSKFPNLFSPWYLALLQRK